MSETYFVLLIVRLCIKKWLAMSLMLFFLTWQAYGMNIVSDVTCMLFKGTALIMHV